MLAQLRDVIRESRQHALRAVDVVQVRTCWAVGRHIVEFEQGGAARAAYGTRLLAELAERLTAEFGKGFAFVARQERISTESKHFCPPPALVRALNRPAYAPDQWTIEWTGMIR